MKIKKQDIERMVKEELESIREANLYHNPQTGRWDSKRAGAVKSLTKKGARSAGIDPKLVGRGVVGSSGKVSAKMGQNFGKDQCGRLNLDGDPINPKYKCGDYKKPYNESLSLEDLDGLNLEDSITVAELLGALAEQDEDILEGLEAQCAQYRQGWMKNLLLSLNNVALARDGKLLEPKKEAAETPRPKTHYRGSPVVGSGPDSRPDNKGRMTADRKQNAKRKKMRSAAGVYVEPFNRGEKALLSTNSLWEWCVRR